MTAYDLVDKVMVGPRMVQEVCSAVPLTEHWDFLVRNSEKCHRILFLLNLW